MTLIHAQILDDAGSGDRQAQERLLSLYAPVTRRIIQRTLSRRFPLWEDGDARQVAELSCVECAARCEDAAAFTGYYVTAATRLCLRERRLYAPALVIPRGEDAPDVDTLEEDVALAPSPEEEWLQSEQVAHLHALVDALPEKLRAVIVRRYGLYGGERQTQAQVARLLGVDRETVKRRETKALSILHQKARRNDTLE